MIVMSDNKRSETLAHERREGDRRKGDRRVGDRRNASLERRIRAGFWYAYTGAVGLGQFELFPLSNKGWMQAQRALEAEAVRYRYLDDTGAFCTPKAVLQRAIHDVRGSVGSASGMNKLHAAAVIEAVADYIIVQFKVTPQDRRLRERRILERRSEGRKTAKALVEVGATGHRNADATAHSTAPSITGTIHPLPLDRISPKDFERLTLWLVEREGYERTETLGEAGSEQGRDLLAWKGGKRVAFQCKRVRRFGPKSAEVEIKKIRGLSKTDKPDELVFVISCAVSARTRKAARAAWGDEQTCHFWAGNELDHKVKQHPEIVEEFFEVSRAGRRFVVRERGIGIAGDVADSQVISGEQVTVNIYSGEASGQRREARSVRHKHRARYADDESEELSGRLKELYSRRKNLMIAGEDPRLIEGEILNVRRLLRKGPLLRAGEVLSDGRYELLEPLGKGGFATVWKAWEIDAERLVALKVLHGHYSEDRSRRERFFRGSRKMAELTHPQIVRVYESEFEDDGWYFFAMEYLADGNFEQAVLTGQLSLEERLRSVLDAGAALAYAHQAGVVHRDVKPSNILLAGDGRSKLSDFDLVRAEDTTGLTATLAMMGTVQYAAPEALASAKDVRPAADVYSLGSTAVFAIRGKALPPLYYRDPARTIAKLGCSESLKRVLAQATEVDPEARQPSVERVCREFEEAASNPSVPNSTEREATDQGATGNTRTAASQRSEHGKDQPPEHQQPRRRNGWWRSEDDSFPPAGSGN